MHTCYDLDKLLLPAMMSGMHGQFDYSLAEHAKRAKQTLVFCMLVCMHYLFEW
jgi:hypothetical protein